MSVIRMRRLHHPAQNAVGPSHHTAPATSRKAALHNYPRSGTQRYLILMSLASVYPDGWADHELQQMHSMNPSSERPRRGELVDAGWAVESNLPHRLTPDKEWAVVWVCTSAGMGVARQIGGEPVVPKKHIVRQPRVE